MVQRGKGTKGSGKKLALQKSIPELLSAYTTTTVDKYVPAPVPPIAEILPSIEVSMVHIYAAIQPMQCSDPFPVLFIVCRLFLDTSQNDIVGPVDKKAVNEMIGFLGKRLAIV